MRPLGFGKMLVFFDAPSGAAMTSDADLAIFGQYDSSGGPWAGTIAPLGDSDDDGLDDLLIGAALETSSGSGTRDQGAVYVVGGAQLTDDLDLYFAQWHVAGEDYLKLGIGLKGADLDGDGRGDVLAGGVGDSTYATQGGAVYLWYATSLSGDGGPVGSERPPSGRGNPPCRPSPPQRSSTGARHSTPRRPTAPSSTSPRRPRSTSIRRTLRRSSPEP